MSGKKNGHAVFPLSLFIFQGKEVYCIKKNWATRDNI